MEREGNMHAMGEEGRAKCLRPVATLVRSRGREGSEGSITWTMAYRRKCGGPPRISIQSWKTFKASISPPFFFPSSPERSSAGSTTEYTDRHGDGVSPAKREEGGRPLCAKPIVTGGGRAAPPVRNAEITMRKKCTADTWSWYPENHRGYDFRDCPPDGECPVGGTRCQEADRGCPWRCLCVMSERATEGEGDTENAEEVYIHTCRYARTSRQGRGHPTHVPRQDSRYHQTPTHSVGTRKHNLSR